MINSNRVLFSDPVANRHMVADPLEEATLEVLWIGTR